SKPSRKRSGRRTWSKSAPRVSRGRKKAWTLEQLEQRHMMSADSGVQLVSMDAYIDAVFARASNLAQYTQAELEAAKSWVVRAEQGTTEAQIEAATGLNFATFTAGEGNIYLLDSTGLN